MSDTRHAVHVFREARLLDEKRVIGQQLFAQADSQRGTDPAVEIDREIDVGTDFLSNRREAVDVLLHPGRGVTVYKLRSTDGFVEESKTISDIDGTALLKAELSDTGIFTADSNKAVLLDYDYKEIWSANMPVNVRNKTINQIAYLQNDYLVFCSKNWSMDAYHTSNIKTVHKNIQSDYSSFAPLVLTEIDYYTQAGFFNAIKDSSIPTKIKDGNYSTKEQQWLTQSLSVARLYFLDATSSDFGIHTEKSVFETDSAGFEAILIQLALLCTDQTQASAASIISESRNKLYCRTLLSNIYGYDPDGKLLDAIERNVSHASSSDSVT